MDVAVGAKDALFLGKTGPGRVVTVMPTDPDVALTTAVVGTREALSKGNAAIDNNSGNVKC